MRPFNLEEAKAGKGVCTRDGIPVDIITFNALPHDYPIWGILKGVEYDRVLSYRTDGRHLTNECDDDLMMATEKREGWINIYENNGRDTYGAIYKTQKGAQMHASPEGYVTTIKIEWEK